MTASTPETRMVLKKNQALGDRSELRGNFGPGKSNVQVLNDPLHDTEVVHHLNKGDEEDDSTQNIGEEPTLIGNSVLIEEEDGADLGFLQEVGGEEGEPLEDIEASTGL